MLNQLVEALALLLHRRLELAQFGLQPVDLPRHRERRRAAGSRVRFVVRELQVADGLLSMIGDEAGAAPPRKRDGGDDDGGDGAGSKKKKKSKRGDKQARDR